MNVDQETMMDGTKEETQDAIDGLPGSAVEFLLLVRE
jgi:hypothetical protein